MYSKILLATDGSEDARRAADHAFKLAETFGASLHVVYVAETAVPIAYEDYLRSEGDTVTKSVGERAAQRGIDVVWKVLEGVPHEEIEKYAERRDVDLIVVGSRGKSGIERRLLGSVTDRLLRTVSVPVLVIRAGT